MSERRISRRKFLVGAGAGVATLALGLYYLRRKPGRPGSLARAPGKIEYAGAGDVWRQKWRWDRVVKGTHNRANCISGCSWNLFVREGVVWREEQNAIYRPSRPDVPDFNPRGCQKGACFSDLQVSGSRVLHPLKRMGPRGSGRWKRISWEQAFQEIADGIIDAAVDGGTESIVYDHGTTNIDFGPDTGSESRLFNLLGATILDSWGGVGDMPMGAVQTWGMFACEGTSDDWFRSDYIMVWAGNPTITRIPEVHFMHEARYRGARLVVIAPDYNATAIHSDLWIAPRAETDAALALAMAHVILEEGLFDSDYIREQTDLPLLIREDTGRFLRGGDLESGGKDDLLFYWDEAQDGLAEAAGCQGHGGRSIALGDRRPVLEGRFEVRLADGSKIAVRPAFERLREHLTAYGPERVASTTGVAAPVIRRVARELANARRAMIFASWGSCKHYHSDLVQRSMILLMALTGNQGKPGGGLRVAAWWALQGFERMAAAGLDIPLLDRLRILMLPFRRMLPREFERLYVKVTRDRNFSPLMPFLYVHAGYDRIWSRPDVSDPAMRRPFDDYVREAVEREWIPVHPKPGNRPRVFLFTGSNPLRRWPAPQIARKHLWPKLDLIVAVNFRTSTTALHADYVLPSAAYYEKYGIKYPQTYLPYLIVSEPAVDPLGEAKSEWEIFGTLAKQIQERSRARGVKKARGPRDKPIDLTTVYDNWSDDGGFDPADARGAMDHILRKSPSIGGVRLDEALREGAVHFTKSGIFTPLHSTSSDYSPNDTYTPHRWFTEDKIPWPTLSGRQQFYIDHPWYEEAGEVLPVHKDPPSARSGFPLRLTGGHTRWSVHSIWRDQPLMLHLQRGEPVCYLSPVDAVARAIRDGDHVLVRGRSGDCELLAKVAPSVQPGQVIIYHAWEPYQFRGWRGQQDPVEAPWKALHLAGGYGQIHYRLYYGAPSFHPRGAPVEVERVGPAGTVRI